MSNPIRTFKDPTWEASLIDPLHIFAIVNIHIITVDLTVEYDKLSWPQMRDRNIVNRLTGKAYVDKVHLKRLLKIFDEMGYFQEDITCYVPHEWRPFLFFPNDNSEMLFSIAPLTPIDSQYNLVPVTSVVNK